MSKLTFWKILAIIGWLLAFILAYFYFGFPDLEASEEYSDTQILWAIFRAEGGYNAQYYFGIRSIPYKDFEDAKRICLRTIQNNRKRYVKYGYKKYPDYLSFLASRYCPIGCDNDKGTNRFWLKNVRYFLMKRK